jgi:hypothetical protein
MKESCCQKDKIYNIIVERDNTESLQLPCVMMRGIDIQ